MIFRVDFEFSQDIGGETFHNRVAEFLYKTKIRSKRLSITVKNHQIKMAGGWITMENLAQPQSIKESLPTAKIR